MEIDVKFVEKMLGISPTLAQSRGQGEQEAGNNPYNFNKNRSQDVLKWDMGLKQIHVANAEGYRRRLLEVLAMPGARQAFLDSGGNAEEWKLLNDLAQIRISAETVSSDTNIRDVYDNPLFYGQYSDLMSLVSMADSMKSHLSKPNQNNKIEAWKIALARHAKPGVVDEIEKMFRERNPEGEFTTDKLLELATEWVELKPEDRSTR